jgi:hypothetical protein
MWIKKFGILAINQKSPKDITEGILFISIQCCSVALKSCIGIFSEFCVIDSIAIGTFLLNIQNFDPVEGNTS